MMETADGFGPYGGIWSVTDGYYAFTSMDETFQVGVNYNNIFSSWQFTRYGNEQRSVDMYKAITGSDFKSNGILLNEVNIVSEAKKSAAHNDDNIPSVFSSFFDSTALATDFHGVSLTTVASYAKDVGEPLVKYNKGVGYVGAAASLLSVGTHVLNHTLTWKDGVTGGLAAANIVLLAVLVIGQTIVDIELTVVLGTMAWDLWSAYDDKKINN